MPTGISFCTSDISHQKKKIRLRGGVRRGERGGELGGTRLRAGTGGAGGVALRGRAVSSVRPGGLKVVCGCGSVVV